MENLNAETEASLHSAQTLRDLLEREPELELYGAHMLLVTMLDTLIRDLEFELGAIESPYTDPLQRRIFLRQIVQTADKILDLMAERFDGELLPRAAIGLCRFLFEETLPVVLRTITIEAEYPEQAEFFEAERTAYALTRTEAEHAA